MSAKNTTQKLDLLGFKMRKWLQQQGQLAIKAIYQNLKSKLYSDDLHANHHVVYIHTFLKIGGRNCMRNRRESYQLDAF